MQIKDFVEFLRHDLATYISNIVLTTGAKHALSQIGLVADQYADSTIEIGVSIEDELRAFCNILYDYAVATLGKQRDDLADAIYTVLANRIVKTGLTHSSQFQQTVSGLLYQPIRISSFALHVLAYLDALPNDNPANYTKDVYFESRLSTARLYQLMRRYSQCHNVIKQVEQMRDIRVELMKRINLVDSTHAGDAVFYAPTAGRAFSVPHPCASQAYSFLKSCYIEIAKRLEVNISEQELKNSDIAHAALAANLNAMDLLRNNIFGHEPSREKLVAILTEIPAHEWLACREGITLPTLYCCILNKKTYITNVLVTQMMEEVLSLFENKDEPLYCENDLTNRALLFLLLEFYRQCRSANPASRTSLWGYIGGAPDRETKLDGASDLQKQLAEGVELDKIDISNNKALSTSHLKAFTNQISIACLTGKEIRNEASLARYRLLSRPSVPIGTTKANDSSSDSSPESSNSLPTAYKAP